MSNNPAWMTQWAGKNKMQRGSKSHAFDFFTWYIDRPGRIGLQDGVGRMDIVDEHFNQIYQTFSPSTTHP
jgi:maltoporin